VDEMLDSMTPEELDGWMIRDQVEPIGYAPQMLGLIAWLIHSYLAGKDATEVEQFMPWIKHLPPPLPQNAQMKQVISSILPGMDTGGSHGVSG
jgi:hypothetical protein